jgi:hypothetical protein
MVHADHVVEGMAMLDEALAAVAGDEVDDFIVLEEIFCQLFAVCEHACDVRRADEWIGWGRPSPGDGTCRRSRRSAAPTTAASSPPPDGGRTPRRH